MSNPGFRIKKTFSRPDSALVAAFSGMPSANIGDIMNRIPCMNSRIIPMNKTPLCGCAFTVKVRAGDNLMLHYAIDTAQPGDVIVVDAQNEQSCAITGELMILWMRKRGLAGLIVDGCIRDIDAISRMDFPVYATGVAANGPSKTGGGEVNFPVMCGGLVVHPGDILVGDADGVVVVPPSDAATVLEKTRQLNAKEVQTVKEIEAGTWDRSWVHGLLVESGCDFIE